MTAMTGKMTFRANKYISETPPLPSMFEMVGMDEMSSISGKRGEEYANMYNS